MRCQKKEEITNIIGKIPDRDILGSCGTMELRAMTTGTGIAFEDVKVHTFASMATSSRLKQDIMSIYDYYIIEN